MKENLQTKKHLNNILGKIKPNTKIYRVISIERFFELIQYNQLVLVKPKLWDDPFENFLSKAIFIDGYDKRQGCFKITDSFFGQCWTQKKECDGIWRNYASLQSGVKIQTTVEKLLNVIYDDNNRFSHLNSFVGKVEYLTDTQIKELLEEQGFMDWVCDTSGKNPAKTLLIKRKEFSYEQEVRVLFSENETLKEENIKKFPINSINFIDSIVFAPKIDKNLFNIYKEKLLQIGFNKKIISKSELYKPIEIHVKNNLL